MRKNETDSVWRVADLEEGIFLGDVATDAQITSMDDALVMGARRSQRGQTDPNFFGLVSDEPGLSSAPSPAEQTAARPQAALSRSRDTAPTTTALRDTSGMNEAEPALSEGGIRDADQPVPRIRIHAACDRHEVARLIQTSAGDRRLGKAQVSIELGGIEAAIARFAGEPSPNLLIIDSVVPARALVSALERLSEVIEGDCKVMIIGATNDIQLYRHLMRIGVSEYLVTPLQPVALIRSIGALYTDPDKPFAGRVAAFLGARGGVGASSVAHNVAWCVAERQGANATLVDLDLPFGTAALDFNEDPSQSIQEALSAADRVDEVFLERVMTRPTQRLQLFTAPARLDRALDIDPDAIGMVMDRVRRTGPHVFLDLPHSWANWMLPTVTSADDIVIVASPDLASLRNAKNIVEFTTKVRPNDAPPVIVLNMIGVPKRPEIPTKDFADNVGAPVVIEIPFDPAAFGAAANNGQMLGQAAEASKAFHQIAALAARLTGRETQAAKPKGFLDRFGVLKR